MKRRVCIIDDDEDLREVVAFALEDDGFEVMPFKSPEEAIASFEQSGKYPGFILLDYFMPKMNGAEFIKLIRSDHGETLGRIPCAISTASDFIEEEIPKDVLNLPKPMELDHLLDLVRNNCL